MEFYKLVMRNGVCHLEEEEGQSGLALKQCDLIWLAQALYDCYQEQDQLPLRFRRYLTAYYADGRMEYIALAEASVLADKPPLDGFATTWLDGEEENRVWLGRDGAIENRGPSGEKVKQILKRLIQAFQQGRGQNE